MWFPTTDDLRPEVAGHTKPRRKRGDEFVRSVTSEPNIDKYCRSGHCAYSLVILAVSLAAYTVVRSNFRLLLMRSGFGL